MTEKALATMPKLGKGYINEAWAREGNLWLDQSMGRRTARLAAMADHIENYDKGYYFDSLIGELHDKLRDLCSVWEFGPYYAETLLAGSDYSLPAHLDAECSLAIHELEEAEIRYKASVEQLEGAKGRFYDSPTDCNYEAYEGAARSYFLASDEPSHWRDTLKALEKLNAQIKHLHVDYFSPLRELLSHLERVFFHNLSSLPLSGEEEEGFDPCHRHIVTMAELRPRLDTALSEGNERKLVRKFMGSVMKDSRSWRMRDEKRTAHLINIIMSKLLSENVRTVVEEYFYSKYPYGKTDSAFMAERIKSRILEPMEKAMAPMFWNQPGFDLRDPSRFLSMGTLFVPKDVATASMAAHEFCQTHSEYSFGKTAMKDRITALCVYSGVPFYVYGGLSLLKRFYDAFGDTPFGICAHLYALTGRGLDGSGKKDWRTDLPIPIPYSGWAYGEVFLDTKVQELVELYEQGEALGIITMHQHGEPVLLKSPALDIKPYTLADFMKKGRFIRKDYDEALRRTEALKAALSDRENCEPLFLTDDGSPHFGEAIVHRVRLDHFIASPVLQQILREELAKHQLVDRVLESMKPILEEWL